jgi:hypothetical protein
MLALALTTLAGISAFAGATVTTLTDSNHGNPGYKDGNTFLNAQFRVPSGVALDASQNYLLLADFNNNAVRLITHLGDKDASYTYTAFNNNDGISHPLSVAIDSATNIYVLNQGNGKNGTLMKFSGLYLFEYWLKYPLATNATQLTNAVAMALDNTGNAYITVEGNKVIKVTPTGVKSVVGVITNSGTSLHGIVVMLDGRLALTDVGNHGIWIMDPANTNLLVNSSKFTGFHGAGNVLGPPTIAAFNQPENLAKAGNNILVVTDFKNHQVKTIDGSGNVNVLYGCEKKYWTTPYAGWRDGTMSQGMVTVQARQPYGLTIANNGTVYVTETYYHLLRMATGTGLPALPPPPPAAPTIWSVTTNYGQVTLTWSPVSGATNYNVKRSPNSGGPYTIIANTGDTTYIDTDVIGGTTYYYVISALNAGGEGPSSAEVSATVPLPPVPDPHIGYVDFPANTFPIYSSVFHEFSSIVLNNDAYIVIVGAQGSQTFYTFGNTPITTNDPPVPNPTGASASAPSGYTDGLSESEVAQYAIAQVLPDLTIKAIGKSVAGNPDSAIVSARVQFVTANPVISGGNAALFTISDVTAGAHLYFTLDGSDPSPTNYTTGIGDLGTVASITNVWSVSFAVQSNTLFKVRAFRSNYQPSAVVSNLFTVAGFKPNTITFGKSSGEPYSKFIARPGQHYYAPVTLNLVPGFGKMYSLQFNVTVTNGYTNTITGAAIPPAVVNETNTDFFSMLMTKVPVEEGTYYPPLDGQWYLPLPYIIPYIIGGDTNLANSKFVDPTNNLLGIGWLYRTGFKYGPWPLTGQVLIDFDTTSQDLITYSIIHDTLFKKTDGLVAVGAYTFEVPNTATNGDQYFIQLGSPSATSDGVGAPGGSIYIAPPNASQAVTVGVSGYVVGDAAPFHWLNAGDFGEGMLDNSDVMQVYQSGVLGVNMPPLNSDLYLAMDSAGGLGAYDGVNNYYTNAGVATFDEQTNMWVGNDLSINTNAFGDGALDINDLYVTFRRSLDPSLLWFQRFWTNGQFVAVTTPNLAFNTNTPNKAASSAVASKVVVNGDYKKSFVTFTAGDALASSGQSIQIPIYAQINGDYPLKVLGLNLSVVPLDGSPALTESVSFTPVAGLGNPTFPATVKGYGNYSAVWLNSTISGLTGNAQIGTLTVPVPAGAPSSAAYAVHFNLASGSPNGLALFPKETVTGLITLSSRTNSSYGDGIPDSWRLRWFGTVNNLLSLASANPSGDGVSNWNKYVAGVDPNSANNFPGVNAKSSVPAGYTAAIHWPSVNGKKYVIERSSTLFPADWTIITTNTGTGGDMEFNDTAGGGVKFYRVRIVP